MVMGELLGFLIPCEAAKVEGREAEDGAHDEILCERDREKAEK